MPFRESNPSDSPPHHTTAFKHPKSLYTNTQKKAIINYFKNTPGYLLNKYQNNPAIIIIIIEFGSKKSYNLLENSNRYQESNDYLNNSII